MSLTISTIQNRPCTPSVENGFAIHLPGYPVPSIQTRLGISLEVGSFFSTGIFRPSGRMSPETPGNKLALSACVAGATVAVGLLTPREAMAQGNANSPEANNLCSLMCAGIFVFLMASLVESYRNKPPKPPMMEEYFERAMDPKLSPSKRQKSQAKLWRWYEKVDDNLYNKIFAAWFKNTPESAWITNFLDYRRHTSSVKERISGVRDMLSQPTFFTPDVISLIGDICSGYEESWSFELLAELALRDDIPDPRAARKAFKSAIIHSHCPYSPKIFQAVVKSLYETSDFINNEILTLRRWSLEGKLEAKEALDRFEIEFLRSYEQPATRNRGADFLLLQNFAEWESAEALKIVEKNLRSLVGVKNFPDPSFRFPWVDNTRCKTFLEAVLKSLNQGGIIYNFFREATQKALSGEMELEQVKGICFAWKTCHEREYLSPLGNIFKNISISVDQVVEASNRSLDWALTMREFLIYRARILKALDENDKTGEEDLITPLLSSKFESHIRARREAMALIKP